MRTAIISDIHGNLEALEAVLKRIEKERVDEVVCLGDIVGYGPDPNECLELIRATCSIVVLGNHDEWVLRRPDYSTVPEAVWQSILWTSHVVSDRHKAWIAGLPLLLHSGNSIYVHASPLFPDRWEYITDAASCMRFFPVIGDATCFVGHSHIPGSFHSSAKFHSEKSSASITGGRIVNVGSVGQPRDGNPEACFVIARGDEFEDKAPEFIRMPYDTDPVARKIRSAGLPEFYAYRLSVGR